jgi:magnesium transporter
MITLWAPGEKGLVKLDGDPGSLCPSAAWIDIDHITPEEEAQVERSLGIDLPTRAEMQEIEASSRLYREGATAYMTVTMLTKTETGVPEAAPVTFILMKERLITLRYADSWSIRTFGVRAPRSGCVTAEQAFCGIFETTVERLADMLEIVAHELEHISQQVFRRQADGRRGVEMNLQKLLVSIGRSGNLLGKVRESLVDKNRAMTFAEQTDWMSADAHARLKAALHDVASLSDHASFTASKVAFLLDACLGLISIEQNRIIRIFSIAAVVFLPPTLVASIYGMNLSLWPGHDAWYGFPLALVCILGVIAGTVWYFKRQRWM